MVGPFQDIKELFMKQVQRCLLWLNFLIINWRILINNDLLSFIDLAPTMLSAAQLKIPRYVQGFFYKLQNTNLENCFIQLQIVLMVSLIVQFRNMRINLLGIMN